MDKILIDNIVSTCGYEALGLYEYLYSIRDEKYNVTIISIKEIADEGAYFDTTTLIESIKNLKDANYLFNSGSVYLFPMSDANCDEFLELLNSALNVSNPEELELLISENNDYQLIMKMFKANKEDVEFGFSEEITGQ